MKKYILIALAAVVIVALVAINLLAESDKPQTTKGSHDISVVAAENQYGSIAKLIGGSNVKVTNIIDNADGDPHTFVSSVKNAKLLAEADVIIYNGADYDSWITPILKTNKNAEIIKVQDLINYPQTEKLGINPHLWYDPDTFPALAAKLKDVFSKQDSVDNSLFEKNLENFNHKYQKVYDLVKQIKQSSSGTPVTATEPLFGYMANALGLDMKGLAFQWVIMNDSEPSPKMMINYQKLFNDKQVKVLFYNKQVTDNVTSDVLEVAKKNNIPVVGITETMPVNDDAINWMIETLQATAVALDKVQK
ncbi:metal ABC transporter solute-binding protein, Zn/Mn family [Francisella tularensis]|uniref:Periplasmic solute binding family protein n=3 Tax=Francisella tularensis TaxID=263 RepID=Q5NI74_FRATT|nr:zinc ABC transporter substrate-binding protein [Francisella tularensis]AAV28929.1 NT02FT1208 [synthetic construct]ACD31438.1 manganese/Zinc/Iron chelate uptake transporter family protein [Francisella tularensis subsp. mediasiatica FSC147]ABO47534.1 Periplasmic solute binding family protein [Francisella tularensis subsp. tularensis WY96-3418]ADA77895.1 Periplasmic solute binding family protein [Francisella tularensis subsp. tularensis NE061598]AFB78325.1 Zinc ABC transporter periplasmic-bind